MQFATKGQICDPYCEADLEVNRRSLVAMRAIGKNRSALVAFTGLIGMNAPVAPRHYSNYNKKLAEASMAEREANMSSGAAVLHKDASEDELVDVRVTCDGTWSRRGFQALYGVVIVAAWDTGRYWM